MTAAGFENLIASDFVRVKTISAFHLSGTTGLPKGVVHSHQTMIAYADLNFQHPGVQDLSRRENNHFNTLALLPLFHIFGFATQMTGLKFRGTVVHNPRFQPKLFLRTIQVIDSPDP